MQVKWMTGWWKGKFQSDVENSAKKEEILGRNINKMLL